MDKRSENFIKMLSDLKRQGLSQDERVDLLKRVRNGTETEEDKKS